MSEHSKHTEAPWCLSSESPRIIKQRDFLGGSGGVLIGSTSGHPASGFFPSDEEAIANAALVVRAVNSHADLLEALRYIATGGEDWNDCVRKARAAIAKAEAA